MAPVNVHVDVSVKVDAVHRKPAQTLRVSLVREPKHYRWEVRLAEGERLLGWLGNRYDSAARDHSIGYAVHVSPDAFRGTGPEDQGNLTDRVPDWLYRGSNQGETQTPEVHGARDVVGFSDQVHLPEPIGFCTRRPEALALLLNHLAKHQAPTVGFGRHSHVTRM